MKAILQYGDKKATIEVPKVYEVISELLDEISSKVSINEISDNFHEGYEILTDFYTKEAEKVFKTKGLAHAGFFQHKLKGSVLDYMKFSKI